MWNPPLLLPRLRGNLALLPLFATGLLLAFNGWTAGVDRTNAPPRILVKLKAPLAGELESSLSAVDLRLRQPSLKVEQWLGRHRIRQLQPLFPHAWKQKKQDNLTPRQRTEAIARRFPQRSRRMAGMEPPDLLRNYVLELTLPAAASVADSLKELRADPNVESASLELVATVQLVPDDPYLVSSNSWGQSYGDLYGHHQLSCPAAWDLNAGAGVIVAVIDTGIDENHPDITANLWINPGEIPGNGIDDDGNGYVDDTRGWDFSDGDNHPQDGHGHGTHVSGTIAAAGNNGLGIPGVAWQAKVMPIKGLSDYGSGSDSQLAEAIVYAADNGADVINASWGGGGYSVVIEEAVDYATSLGVVFVAAAGNNNEDTSDFFPTNLTNAIAVSAVDFQDTKAFFSNFGPKLDVAAPGVDVLSLMGSGTSLGTAVGSNYSRLSGTSMAAPHVAGVVALLLSAHGAYSPDQVRQALRASADDVGIPGVDIDTGYGRVNARRILELGAPLRVRLQAPLNNVLLSGTITVQGTADGPDFAGYSLDYGPGAFPTNWTLIQTSTVAQVDAVLGSFNSDPLPDNTYTIRLRAFAASGSVFADFVRTRVDNLSISYPPAPHVRSVALTLKPGAPVPISGTATGPFFQRYSVEWAQGVYPASGWSTSGVSLASGGLNPLTNAVLATLDTQSITQADYYSVRLSVENGGFTNEERTLIYFEPALLSTNWPQYLEHGPDLFSSVLPMRTASGQTRLIVSNPIFLGTSFPVGLWSFSADGADRQMFPLEWGGYPQPAIGDLDGQPGDEIVAQDVYDVRIIGGVYSSNSLRGDFFANFNFSPLTIEDLDGDGRPEILAFSNIPGGSGSNSYLFAWAPDGTLHTTNFPITLHGHYWATELDRAYNRGLLVVDLDADGRKEILAIEFQAPAEFRFRLFNHDGTPRAWPARTFPGRLFTLVGADLERDGIPEVILAYYVPGTNDLVAGTNFVEVLRADGTTAPGWPLATQAGFQLAIADLDRDGSSEIVATAGALMNVFRANGTVFPGAWPIEGDGFMPFGNPVVADIDGDGWPEILAHRLNAVFVFGNAASNASSRVAGSIARPGGRFTPAVTTGGALVRPSLTTPGSIGPAASGSYFDPQLVAFRHDGSILRSWRMLGAHGNQPYGLGTTVVGDFNQDGKIDIAVNYSLVEGGDLNGYLIPAVLTVLTLDAPYHPHVADWPMNYHDPRNTATGFIPTRLKIENLGTNGLITWPIQPYASALESSEPLTPLSWTPLSPPVTVSNGLNRVLLPLGGSRKFYRLHYP